MTDRNNQIILNSLYSANRGFPINPNGKEICGIKPKNNDTYFEYDFQKAKDFLNSIDVTSELYFNEPYNHKRNCN